MWLGTVVLGGQNNAAKAFRALWIDDDYAGA